VPRRGDEHVAELPERVLADDLRVEEVTSRPDVRRRAGDVEVVGPEVDHHLEQLALGPGGAGDVRVAQVEHRVPLEAADAADQGRRRHPQGRPATQQRRHRVVVDPAWAQLLVEPGIGALLPHPVEELRRRAVGGAPHQVQHRVRGGSLGLGRERHLRRDGRRRPDQPGTGREEAAARHRRGRT